MPDLPRITTEPVPPRHRWLYEVRWVRGGERQDTKVLRFARLVDAERAARRLYDDGYSPEIYRTPTRWERLL